MAHIDAPKNPGQVSRENARAELETAKTNAAKANAVPALRDEVVRLAKVVESLLDNING